MRFTLFSGFPGKPVSFTILPEHFFCGGLLLLVGSWVTLNPPPEAPKLRWKCEKNIKLKAHELETTSEKHLTLTVWVDTSSGLYYYATASQYGRTAHGKYMHVKTAKRQGYRTSAGF